MGVREDIQDATDEMDSHIQSWMSTVLQREMEPVALTFEAIRSYRETLTRDLRKALTMEAEGCIQQIEGWLADLDELSTFVKEL